MRSGWKLRDVVLAAVFLFALIGLSCGSAFADVVIDNSTAGTSFTGTWAASGASGYYGTNSLWSRDGATYTWTFTPSATGNYELSMWWTVWPSRSTSIPVSIEYSGGTANVVINEQVGGNQWNVLGTYAFQAGVSYKVTITSQPGPSSTSADAVKFVQVSGNIPPVAVIDSITPNPALPGDSVTFSGSGSDSDGSIIGYTWSSNIDGLLGSAKTFSTTALSEGIHVIYFKGGSAARG